MNKFIDHHIHTKYCHHAHGEMEDYVQAGIAKGLEKIVFLEHFEVGIKYYEVTWLTPVDFGKYITMGQTLQRQYQGQIDIGIGTEIGFNPDHILEITEFIASYNWDFVGLSYHYLDAGNEHLNMVSSKKINVDKLADYGHQQVLTRYYQDLLLALEVLKVDFCCHLDAVLRYSPDIEYLPEHWCFIAEILAVMAKRRICLEINTAGYGKRGEPYPAERIQEMAKERGVEFLLGSDAHTANAVGQFFDRY